MSEYAFNPITGTLDRVGDGGGGGSITITTDSGTITGNEFSLQGQEYKNVPVMEVTNQDTEIYVANNSWTTPYIVDPSSIDGEKGTFTTIQSAIDSAFANLDGSPTKFATILIRNNPLGTFTENLIFPDGNFHITSLIPANLKNTFINSISGVHTIPEAASVVFENLLLIPDSGSCFINSGKTILVNCFCQAVSNNSSPSSFFYAYNSNILGLNLSAGSFEAYDCQISSDGTLENVIFSLKDCKMLVSGFFILNGLTTGSFLNCYDLVLNGDTTGNINFDNVSLYTTANLPNANIYYNEISFSPLATGTQFFTTVFTNLFKRPSESGNVWKRRVSDVDVDYIVAIDQYIGITTTNDSTLTFVDSGFVKEQVWYVFDESGNASNSPRTILPDSPRTINGESSLVINQDYGWAIITFDGNNYFAFTSPPGATSEFNNIGELSYFANENGDAYLNGKWLKCDGSVVNQADYPILFSRMGLINAGGVNWSINELSKYSGSDGAYGNNIFLTAGLDGLMLRSTDGLIWNEITSGFSSNINALAFGNNRFIYGGDDGVLSYSDDGIKWFTTTPSIGVQEFNVNEGLIGPYLAYGNSTFAAISREQGGGLITSSDGITWETQVLPEITELGAIVFADSKFVIGGANGFIATSSDAITWTTQTSGTINDINYLSYGNGTFLAGAGGDQKVLISGDAVSWAFVNFPSIPDKTGCVIYGNSIYLASMINGNVFQSSDINNWSLVTGLSHTNKILYNGTLFISGSETGQIHTSPDGTTWTLQDSGSEEPILTLIYQGGLNIYAGKNGTIGTSTDGITWTVRSSGTDKTISVLGYVGTTFYACGCNFVLTSSDGITWVPNNRLSNTNNKINSIIYADSKYVFSGDAGIIGTSTDGETWTLQTTGTTENINALTYGTNFIFGGDNGVIATSSDAITWSLQTSGTIKHIYGLTYGSSLYVYGGQDGVIYTSPDGITWTQRTSPTIKNINDLDFADGNFVYVSDVSPLVNNKFSSVGSSDDGITWFSREVPVPGNYKGIFNGNGSFFITNVIILSSPTDYLYDPVLEFQLPTDSQLSITQEEVSNFKRSLYIKAKM